MKCQISLCCTRRVLEKERNISTQYKALHFSQTEYCKRNFTVLVNIEPIAVIDTF